MSPTATRIALLFVAFYLAMTMHAAKVMGEGLGALDVRVVHVNAPLSGAHIIVAGASVDGLYTATTNVKGIAEIDGLRPGAYRITIKIDGYESLADRAEVRADQVTLYTGDLVPLHTIANVRSHRVASAFVGVVDGSAAVRKFSPTLLDALSRLGGVQITQVNGLGALFSIQGQDSSATQYQVNGVPLAGSGAALAVNTDLLAQASVDQVNDQVSFNYLNPTLYPRYTMDASQGGFGSTFLRVTAQATSGQVGIALTHAQRLQDSILNTQVYEDLSGQTYEHAGTLVNDGNFLKLTAPLGTWSAGVQGDFSTSVTQPIPTYFTGDLPAGYGPGEIVRTRTSNAAAYASGGLGLGSSGGSFSLSDWNTKTDDDYADRIIQGISLPYHSETNSRGTSARFLVEGTTPFFATEQISLSEDVFDETSLTAVGTGTPVPGTFSSTQLHLEADFTHQARQHQSTDLQIKSESTSGAVGVQVQPSYKFMIGPHDTVQVVGTGGTQSVVSSNATTTLADPAAASNDCNGGTITVPGPGDTRATPDTYGISAGLVHQAGRAQVSVLGYARRVDGAMLSNALVPLSLEPQAYASPSFVNALRTGYSSNGGCSGPAPSDDRIFFLEDVAGISAIYRGGTIDVTYPLSRRSVLEGTYTYTGAVVAALDQRLTGGLSPYITGQQLPNIAPQALGVTLDSTIGARTEMLLHYQWTAANNPRNLPAYAEFAYGIVRNLSPGTSLSIIESNVTGTYAGAFVSPEFALNVPTRSGVPFPTVASPLRPATLFVQLSLKKEDSGANASLP